MRSIIILCLAVMIGGGTAAAQSELANGVAVIVNDVVITYKDVETSIAPAIELLVRQYGDKNDELARKLQDLRRQRIEELVEEQLILHDFTNAGFKLPESLIEDEVQKRIRDRYGNRVTMTKEFQTQGRTYESFHDKTREDIIISVMSQRNITSELVISPHKIEAYYEQNQDQFKLPDRIKRRTIVFNKSKDAPERARRMAQEVLAKIESGVPFAEMAAVNSEGTQTSLGSESDFVSRDSLRKDMVEAAFALKPGQHTGVIESPEDCCIILVEDFQLAHIRPLSEVRDAIEKTLIDQERARLRKKWVDRLKNKSFVRYF